MRTGCKAHDRKFLFELLVPAEDAQLQAVGGDADRYDAELRPELMRRAIAEIQDAGIEVDIWKIEGVDERSDCEMLVAQARVGRPRRRRVRRARPRRRRRQGRPLARPQAAPVEGFIGFAIGRSIWWDPLKAYVDGKIERSAGARSIAENYLRFVTVYERAEGARSAPSAGRRRDRHEDAPEPRRLGAGLRPRDLAGPPPAGLAAPHRRAAHAQARSADSVRSAARCASCCSSLTLILTAVVVTVVMFRTLYLLLG